MNRISIILSSFILSVATATAQNLEVFNAADLVGHDSDAPQYAILLQEYCQSPECFSFQEKLLQYVQSNVASDPETLAAFRDVIILLQNSMKEAQQRGDTEEVREYRLQIEQIQENLKVMQQAGALMAVMHRPKPTYKEISSITAIQNRSSLACVPQRLVYDRCRWTRHHLPLL